MNRRELLKALPAVAAITVAVPTPEINEGQTFVNGWELDKQATYLFVVKRGISGNEAIWRGLSGLNVKGTMIFVDDPEEDLRIYRIGMDPAKSFRMDK